MTEPSSTPPPGVARTERVPARLSHHGGGRAVLNTGEVIPLPRPIPPELDGKRTVVVVKYAADGHRSVRVAAPSFDKIRPPVPKGPRRKPTGRARRTTGT